jgi:hypothetical protein
MLIPLEAYYIIYYIKQYKNVECEYMLENATFAKIKRAIQTYMMN